LPKEDLYKDRFIIIGFVLDAENKPLKNARIYLGNNTIISKTDGNGNFRLVLNRHYKGWAFIIRKEGYESMAITFDNQERDVYTGSYLLSKQ
jgi:hypothetical protein